MKKAFMYLLLLGPLSGSAQQPTDTLIHAMDAIFEPYSKNSGPGCAVAVVKNGQVIFSKGYGMANLEYDIPITAATIFDIASVSKQFTGLAVSMLIEQGKISLDDDIHKYLPDIPRFDRTITIQQLLHHISGIRDWPQTLHAAGWRWDEVFSFEDIMRMVKYQVDLDFEPGSQYSYSNTGYNLLAAVVEKVTKQRFREWTDSAIFTALGMRSSHFRDDPAKIIKNLAYSYTPGVNGFANIPGELTAYGSSSLFTSVDDLSKWVIHFQQQVTAKNPVYLRMLTAGTLNNGDKVPYGFGLGLGEDRGLKTISHTGGWAGYRTIITNYPDEQLSIIILSNAADFDPTGYAQKVADLLLKGKFRITNKTPENLSKLPNVQVDSSLLKKYAGSYQLGPGWIVTLTLENGRLMTQANGEDKFPTEAKSDSVFWIDAYGASMTFVQDPGGHVDLLKYKSILAKRITPVAHDPATYPGYRGVYYSKELATEYVVDTAGNKLFMHHMRLGKFELLPDLSDSDQFSGEIGSIKFFKNEKGELSGFKLSGGRIKNIRFNKRQ